LVMHAEGNDLPSLIIDFGSVNTDLSIFDTTLRVTGTVQGGGDTLTNTIAKALQVTPHQANLIKTKYGLYPSKHQKKVEEALNPLLTSMANEIKKMIRFYQERTGKERTLGQVIIIGGGANMPGMADFLTDKIRVPARTCNPWINLDFGELQPPHQLEKTLYATAAGLALIDPERLHQ
jgi:Tfp pilus assembly PilM family ATPase